MASKNHPQVISFLTDDRPYIVYSASNLLLDETTAKELQNALFKDFAADLVFYMPLGGSRIVSTDNRYSPLIKQYERIVEEASSVSHGPKLTAIGIIASSYLAPPISLLISQILELEALFFPIIGQGVASYKELSLNYYTYRPVPETYYRERRHNVQYRTALPSIRLPTVIDSLEQAAEIWKGSDQPLVTKKRLEGLLRAQWPDYTYKRQPVLEYLLSAQSVAQDIGIADYWSIPLYYDLSQERLLSGLDTHDGSVEAMQEEATELDKKDDMLVLYR